MRRALSFAVALFVSALGAGAARAGVIDVSLEVIPQWQTGQCPTTAKVIISVEGDPKTQFYVQLIGDANVPPLIQHETLVQDDEAFADVYVTTNIVETLKIDPSNAGSHYVQARVWENKSPSYQVKLAGDSEGDFLDSSPWRYAVNCTKPAQSHT